MKTRVILIVLIVSAAVYTAASQTTEFTYQGSLNDGASPATGNYDFQFLLFDAVSGGTQLGSTLSKPAVQITNGGFSVKLDFGTQFTGADRYLEIRVRSGGGGGYTILDPRQRVTSSPYSVKSLSSTTADNALNLGGVPASQYVTSPSGSAGFIQNTVLQQPSSNFHISGNGWIDGSLDAGNDVNVFNSYKIQGQSILSKTGFNNLFAGESAGSNNTGQGNAFLGSQTGISNTQGYQNTFVGSWAGNRNVAGSLNSFYGTYAGYSNMGGSLNAFFGTSAGRSSNSSNNSFFGFGAGFSNTSGDSNSFFGDEAGYYNVNGIQNTFAGMQAGYANTSGEQNVFVGTYAGLNNTTGSWNTAIGSRADVGPGLNNATAIGNAAYVTQSNSLVVGAINGIHGAGSSTNVGIGTMAPKSRLHVAGGNIYIANPNSLVITSPNGACWFITVNNSGQLGANPVTCP